MPQFEERLKLTCVNPEQIYTKKKKKSKQHFTYVKSSRASITTQKIPSIFAYDAEIIIVIVGKPPMIF